MEDLFYFRRVSWEIGILTEQFLLSFEQLELTCLIRRSFVFCLFSLPPKNLTLHWFVKNGKGLYLFTRLTRLTRLTLLELIGCLCVSQRLFIAPQVFSDLGT